MRLPFNTTSDSKKKKILHELKNVEFEDMFSNFDSMPFINFAVSDEDICDQFWAERPIRRTLFEELDQASNV